MKSQSTKSRPAPESPQPLPTPGVGASLQVSFALYSAANRVIRLHRPLLEPIGITYPQYLVMVTLYASAPRTVGEVGAALDMDTGTLTPLLKRLEAAGLVTRTRDTADERRVLIDLTDRGRSLLREFESVPSKVNTKCDLTEADQAALRDTLNGLARPAKE
jgi:MarR family transcriptional regulator, organic hydroperoxide resistance regulator